MKITEEEALRASLEQKASEFVEKSASSTSRKIDIFHQPLRGEA